ncbi:hypothetical protein EGR_09336 [Echinococcus granulosus]|uniref:Uncharacterized protein n=1 Tax=Echinococcus granulosus TaxID=6210 RepID=W6U3Z7_ECHGR|nr:hypothetical protein EGR_09336 [Echinococcus granulosus]EUB55820.1 hypothetical protein EGR_09336 [Echinococcus granulosus]
MVLWVTFSIQRICLHAYDSAVKLYLSRQYTEQAYYVQEAERLLNVLYAQMTEDGVAADNTAVIFQNGEEINKVYHYHLVKCFDLLGSTKSCQNRTPNSVGSCFNFTFVVESLYQFAMRGDVAWNIAASVAPPVISDTLTSARNLLQFYLSSFNVKVLVLHFVLMQKFKHGLGSTLTTFCCFKSMRPLHNTGIDAIPAVFNYYRSRIKFHLSMFTFDVRMYGISDSFSKFTPPQRANWYESAQKYKKCISIMPNQKRKDTCACKIGYILLDSDMSTGEAEPVREDIEKQW